MIPLLVSWTPAGLWAGVIFYLSSRSNLPGPGSFPFGDKGAHFVVFGILGLTLAWGARRMQGTAHHLLLLGVGLAYAVADEWHQSHVPGRDPSAGDFVADAAGLLLGYVLARVALKWWLRDRVIPPG